MHATTRLRHLIRDPTQQRLRLTLLAIGLGIWQPPPLALAHLSNAPTALLLSRIEKLLILIETAPPTLGRIQPRPHAGEDIGGCEHEKDPVFQVVEEDGRQQGDGEVGQAPDYDGHGGALGARRGRVDFGGDQPDGGEPADAEGTGGDEERHDPRDGNGGDGDVQRGVVFNEAAEEGEEQEAAAQYGAAPEEQRAAAECVDEDPGPGH